MTEQSFLKTTILLLYLQSVTSNSATSSSPVHEVINERIDDKPVFTAPSSLPYGNPLAGNSQHNARLHAQNQQAMFNAERIRQHKAQILRWTKTPPQVDSYMKAYQESQENHQLALEQQQINQREQRPITNAPKVRGTRPESYGVTMPMKMRVTRPNIPVSVTAASPRLRTTRLESPTTAPSIPKRTRTRLIGRNIDRNPKIMPSPEAMKITKADAMISDRNRNHRSYGSNDYHQYLQTKRYQSVYVSPGPTYDQGVTIKPNGSPGQPELQNIQEDHKLYTEAVPSKTQYVYPKQYNQMQSYESVHDIDALNLLLKKSPSDQVSELNALINSGHKQEESSDLNTPIDLYFYLKDPTVQTLTQHYDQANYAQLPHSAHIYAQAYTKQNSEYSDIKPTKEEIDDVADPNQNTKAKYYGYQTMQTEPPLPDTTTTKSNNYYKVEVASQIVSAGHKKVKPQYSETPKYYYKEEENSPTHQSVQYVEQPLALHYNAEAEHLSDTLDSGLIYSHQNIQPQGVQHLTEDGTGVSAYGEDNLHYAASYEFGYRVRDSHSGNHYGHREAKQDGETRGQYYVLLPDGRMQNVNYSAGPEGFHADISYDHLH